MLNRWICLAVLFITSSAGANGSQVIDVRRNITLSDDEVPYKDFYLSGGQEAGYKVNQVVKAVRSLTIRDASGAQSYGQIQVPVGQIKIIAVYDKVAVGREFKLLSRDDLPMLEQIGIMTGDAIDFKDVFIDKNPPKKRTPQMVTPNQSQQALQVAPSTAAQAVMATASPPPSTAVPAEAEKLEIKAQSDN